MIDKLTENNGSQVKQGDNKKEYNICMYGIEPPDNNCSWCKYYSTLTSKCNYLGVKTRLDIEMSHDKAYLKPSYIEKLVRKEGSTTDKTNIEAKRGLNVKK